MSNSDDAALVERIAAGDGGALETLFHRHARAAVNVARRTLAEQTLAYDVVQDVFMRLWQAPHLFDPLRGPFRNFLLLQTRGRAIELIRSHAARADREVRDAWRQVNEDDRELGSGVELDEDIRMLHDALVVLRDAERVAIELAFFGGLTYCEVAEALGVAEGTVKSRIRRGLERLAPVLTTAGYTSR